MKLPATRTAFLCAAGIALVGCAGAPPVNASGYLLTSDVSGWTSAGGPARHPVTGAPGEEVLRVRWRRLLTEPGLIEYKPQEFASATSGGGRIYVGSRGGWFFALRPRDGEVLWKHAIDGGVSAQPLFLADARIGDDLNPAHATGVVYVGGSDGAMHAFDAATGKERWTYRTKGPIGGAPVYNEGLLYFANGENRVFCLDARTGAWRWQYEREAPDSFTIRGYASPLVFGGRVYAGFSDGYLVALNARVGDVIWARSLAGSTTARFADVDATPVLVDGTLYAASYSAGVYALQPSDGSVRWRYDVEGATTVSVLGDRVYFAATRAGVHCLDKKGHLVWQQALAAQGELSPPTVVDGRWLMVSASDGGSFVVDPPSGRLLQFFDPGHGVTSMPATDGKQIYILTNAGFLYAFALRS